MAKPKIITYGQLFGYLSVIREVNQIHDGKRRFLVRCICGKEKEVDLCNLLNKSTVSCGCIKAKKHNMSNTRIYHIWQGMRYRCYTKTCSTYKNYGAKGIKVCDEWRNSFAKFYKWSIKNNYNDNLTIDRINPKGDYEPNNCRWVDWNTQSNNKELLSTNTSGYVGLSWSNKYKKWICNISLNNKSKRIGAYNTQKEGIEARNKFIEDNHLPHKKNIYIGEIGNRIK